VVLIRKEETAPPEASPPELAVPAAAAPGSARPQAPSRPAPPTPASADQTAPRRSDDELFDLGALEGMTMADLLGPEPGRGRPGSERKAVPVATQAAASRTVDDFDFDEEAFLAALDENEIVGTTGEVVSGTVVGVESDGVYVDIGGKAPGFMPKQEAGLGVITNLKERFPKGLRVEVLVTREQNADGMVTISARALALRQSWEKVRQLEKDGKVAQVVITGFNRGGVTCDLEGLRGFIPRSQLQDGENHEALVGKTLGVSFLEVNPETRQVAAIKPYGFFVDLGGVSGLLHHSSITGGALRDLREAFELGERLKALITQLDPGRGRIALNTALLEGQPGELLIAKATVMAEATDRANRARSLLRQKEQEAG
jgi:small subunit ribosomal protein S1